MRRSKTPFLDLAVYIGFIALVGVIFYVTESIWHWMGALT